MNKTQKIILSVIVTLILFVLAYSWSTNVEKYIPAQRFSHGIRMISPTESYYINVKFYELQYNWYVWILFIIVSGSFNFWLYSDKRQNKKKEK